METSALRTFAIAFVVLAVGCSSSSGSSDRTNQSSSSSGSSGVDLDGGMPPPDPNDGRDDKASSCYAACANVAFQCRAKGSTMVTTVDMANDMNGCLGLVTDGDKMIPIQLDCNMRKVCLADAPGGMPTNCVDGKYSGTSFAYTPAGAMAELVCNRTTN